MSDIRGLDPQGQWRDAAVTNAGSIKTSPAPNVVDFTFHSAATAAVDGEQLNVRGYSFLLLAVFGTSTDASIAFKASPKDRPEDFQAIYGLRTSTLVASTTVASLDTTTAAQYVLNVRGYEKVIVDLTAIANGNISVRGTLYPDGEAGIIAVKEAVANGMVVQGAAASDAAEAGNPLQVGGSVDDTSPTAAGEGDVRRARVDNRGDWRVVGDLDHDAPDAGSPIKIGGEANTGMGSRAAVADGDRTDALFDQYGSQGVFLTRPFAQQTVNVGDLNADGLGATTIVLETESNPRTFNGTTWDRRRGVVQTTNYIAASLVSATQNGADRTNYNFKGLSILVDVTTRNGTSTITLALQAKDGNGNYSAIWTAAAALSATGQAKYLIYPTAENTESWTEMANSVLGSRTYRVIATYGGADTISFDVDLVELPN